MHRSRRFVLGPGAYLASRGDAFKFSADHLLGAGYGRSVLRVARPVYRVTFVDVRGDVEMSSWFHPLFETVVSATVYPSLVVVASFLICCVLRCRGAWRLIRRRGQRRICSSPPVRSPRCGSY